MENFNKMINFVKSSYKKTTKRINYIEHLTVTKPTCENDELGIIARFAIIAILMSSAIFIGDTLVKLFSILCLVFVFCFILKEPEHEQK